MPVAPVECVHRKERRVDLQRLERVDLVLADELSMDENRAAVRIAVFCRRLANAAR